MVFVQGHSSPGIYARAFLEGRLGEEHLSRFRQEVGGGGLSSYPHPWLMPEFWQFPTVSMGLGPMMAIYQARFMRYMEHRGMVEPSDRKVWAFLGDGEMDEPESMGAITMPVREGLDNLVFVVNCNLQRLDGPVRGNGKIIQELEGAVPRRRAGTSSRLIWGSRTGTRCWPGITKGLLQAAHGKKRWTESSRTTRLKRRRLHPRAFLREVPGDAQGNGRQPVATRRHLASQPRRPRSSQQGVCRL